VDSPEYSATNAQNLDTCDLALWTRDLMGKPQMAGGARFSARAWANYGKLWLQNGQWEGRPSSTRRR
jgi:hypothetical protein